MSGSDSTDGSVRKPDWTIIDYVGAHGTKIEGPTADALGLSWVHDVCDRLWLYSRADFEPSHEVPVGESQWRETCALAGSIAESLMLATAALVEIDWHTQALQGGREPKAMILAQRFLADAVCENVIAVGHRLINLIARVIRTDSNARNAMHDTQSATALNLGPLGRDYIPFVTMTSTAWLSLDVGRVRQLRRVAPQNSTGIATALDRLKELSMSPAWKAAFDHRGINFHRWRLENEYVAGVDQNSSSMKDVVDYRDTVVGRSYGARRQEYTAADGLTAQVATDARAGLEEVAHAADAVLDAILVALPEITNGYVLAIDNVKKKFSKTRRIP